MCNLNVEVKKVNLKSGDEAIAAFTPYSSDFVSGARKLNGRWSENSKCWIFDLRDEERVRELCRKIYGTDGATPDLELVTIKVYLDKISTDDNSLELFARSIAYRPGRDSEVKLGNGVIVVEGGFKEWGGSRNHPALNPRAGTVLEVRDVPKSIIKLEDFPEGAIEILSNDKKVNVQALKDEATAIRKRLAEILEILSKEGEQA